MSPDSDKTASDKLGAIQFTIRSLLAVFVVCGVLFGCNSNSDNEDPRPQGNTPNILFFILDDVGIDQMQSFGYGGETAPQTPN